MKELHSLKLEDFLGELFCFSLEKLSQVGVFFSEFLVSRVLLPVVAMRVRYLSLASSRCFFVKFGSSSELVCSWCLSAWPLRAGVC